MKIYCFGNEFVKKDSLARKIADELNVKGVEFVKCDSVDELLRGGSDAVILDVVEGLNKVKILGIDDLSESKTSTSHDIDLGYELNLLSATKDIGDIVIIGIPMEGKKEDIRKQVEKLVKAILR